MKNRSRYKCFIIIFGLLFILGRTDVVVFASGNQGASETDIVSVELPVMEENNSVFDFIMDPQGLINATNAVKYGGRSFEEGATIYFENRSGEYDFSDRSDWVNITNKSKVPIKLTINVQMHNISDIKMIENDEFGNSEEKELFLALVDSDGNVYSVDKNGTAVVEKEIAAANEDIYTCYLFRLTGACNPNGDWRKLKGEPRVKVEWTIKMDAEDEELIATPTPTPTATITENETPTPEMVPMNTPMVEDVTPEPTADVQATPETEPTPEAESTPEVESTPETEPTPEAEPAEAEVIPTPEESQTPEKENEQKQAEQTQNPVATADEEESALEKTTESGDWGED